MGVVVQVTTGLGVGDREGGGVGLGDFAEMKGFIGTGGVWGEVGGGVGLAAQRHTRTQAM